MFKKKTDSSKLYSMSFLRWIKGGASTVETDSTAKFHTERVFTGSHASPHTHTSNYIHSFKLYIMKTSLTNTYKQLYTVIQITHHENITSAHHTQSRDLLYDSKTNQPPTISACKILCADRHSINTIREADLSIAVRLWTNVHFTYNLIFGEAATCAHILLWYNHPRKTRLLLPQANWQRNLLEQFHVSYIPSQNNSISDML